MYKNRSGLWLNDFEVIGEEIKSPYLSRLINDRASDRHWRYVTGNNKPSLNSTSGIFFAMCDLWNTTNPTDSTGRPMRKYR